MSPSALQYLEHYGVVILPALAVAEQIGLPLPAMPALLAVGALAAHGRISIPLVLGAISAAALATDFAWYELGRRRGARVLARLCRLSLEPDSCLRRAENIFGRHGARSMLVAKFVPGLTTVLPPLAGYVAGARILLQRCHRPDHRPSHGARAHARPRHRDRARRVHPGQVRAPPSVPAEAPHRHRLARGAQAAARRWRKRHDHRSPDTARGHGHTVRHPGEPLAGRRRHRRARGPVPPNSGGRALLDLARRRDERPGPASAETQGDHSGPFARGRPCRVDGPEVSRSSGSAPSRDY